MTFNQQQARKFVKTEKTSKQRNDSSIIVPNPCDVQHYGIRCSYCNILPIVGKRYKCGYCREYSLCETCNSFRQHLHAHGNHVFIELRQRIHDRDLENSVLLPVALLDNPQYQIFTKNTTSSSSTSTTTSISTTSTTCTSTILSSPSPPRCFGFNHEPFSNQQSMVTGIHFGNSSSSNNNEDDLGIGMIQELPTASFQVNTPSHPTDNKSVNLSDFFTMEDAEKNKYFGYNTIVADSLKKCSIETTDNANPFNNSVKQGNSSMKRTFRDEFQPNSFTFPPKSSFHNDMVSFNHQNVPQFKPDDSVSSCFQATGSPSSFVFNS